MKGKLYTVHTEERIRIGVAISDALKQHGGVSFAYLFGSFIDRELPFHAIDLGIYFTLGKNRFEMSETALDLAVALSNTLAFPVDVRVLNHATVAFVYNVMRGQLIYEANENVRCRVMEDNVRNYLDMKPILCRAAKEAFSSHGS